MLPRSSAALTAAVAAPGHPARLPAPCLPSSKPIRPVGRGLWFAAVADAEVCGLLQWCSGSSRVRQLAPVSRTLGHTQMCPY